MSNDLDNFKTPEFLEALKQYEDMKKGLTSSCYLDTDAIADIMDYYETVNNDMKASDEVLNYGLQMHPEDSELCKYKLQHLLMQNRLDETEALLQNQEASDPEIKLIKATLFFQLGKNSKGIQLIKETMEQVKGTETEAFCYHDVGEILLNAKMSDLAFSILEKGNKLFPNNTEIKTLYVEACQDRGELPKAAKLINEMLDEDPYDIEQWILLAQTYIGEDEFEKAQEALDFASAIDENYTEIDTFRALCFYQQGIYDKACEYYKKIFTKFPNNEIAAMFASACFMNMEQDAKAASYIEQAIRIGGSLSSQFINMRIQAAIIFLHLHNYEKALYYINEAIEEDETISQGHILRGQVLIQQGNFLEGEAEFNTAMKNSKDLNDSYLQIGMAYYDTHHYGEALSYFKRLSSQSERNIAMAYMADCFLQTGKNDEYFTCLKSACLNNPEAVKNVFKKFIPEGIAPEHFYEYVRKNWNGYSNNPFNH